MKTRHASTNVCERCCIFMHRTVVVAVFFFHIELRLAEFVPHFLSINACVKFLTGLRLTKHGTIYMVRFCRMQPPYDMPLRHILGHDCRKNMF